jgi:hypothetical protein
MMVVPRKVKDYDGLVGVNGFGEFYFMYSLHFASLHFILRHTPITVLNLMITIWW